MDEFQDFIQSFIRGDRRATGAVRKLAARLLRETTEQFRECEEALPAGDGGELPNEGGEAFCRFLREVKSGGGGFSEHSSERFKFRQGGEFVFPEAGVEFDDAGFRPLRTVAVLAPGQKVMRNHAADENQIPFPERLDAVADDAGSESRLDQRKFEFRVDMADAVEHGAAQRLDAERLFRRMQHCLIVEFHAKKVS